MRRLFIVLSLFILYFIPELASVSWSKKLIENSLSYKFKGKVTIEKLSLGWTRQKLHQVHFIKDSMECSCSLLEVRNSPLELLQSKPLLLFIQSGKATLQKKKKKLQMTLSPIRAKLEKNWASFEKVHLQVNEKFELFSQGRIHLEKNFAEITLGIEAHTLNKFLKITQVPDDFFLEIPLSGPFDIFSLEKKLPFYLLKHSLF